jgi:lipoprotein-anchoring transpeptidase ErfK/SrfK
MRRVLAHAFAAAFVLGLSPAVAHEGQLAMSLPSPLAGAAIEQGVAIEQASATLTDEPPAFYELPKEPAAASRPHARPAAPVVTLLLKADLTAQTLTVMEDDRVLHVWAISSGRRGYATPIGTFRPAWMARMWRSRQYDDAPMPHSIFFNKGIAFHATTAVSMLGRPASHGCLRLAPAHAAQLFALVRRHGLLGTQVVVHGAAVFPPPSMAGLSQAQTRREAARARQRAAQTAAGGGLLEWLFNP